MKRPFRVSLVKEKIPSEKRVLLLPKTVSRFREAGFDMFVESGAGEGIGISDSCYIDSGAAIVDEASAWKNTDLVLKYKAPVPEEFRFLWPGLRLAAIMHAEGDLDLVKALLSNKVTAFSFEFFKDDQGRFPLAEAGGQIAGKMATLYGAYHLQTQYGGIGKLAVSSPYHQPVRFLIIGSGNVGLSSAKAALDFGADVTVLCSSADSAMRASSALRGKATCIPNSPETLSRLLPTIDVLVGAILISTFDTPPMITESMVQSMRQGSVIVDATAGYGGGYMPTFDRNTSLAKPFFIKHGVVHIKIDNFPAAVPLSSVEAVNEVYPRHLLKFMESQSGGELDLVSEAAKITHNGQITHDEVERHFSR